MSETLAQHRLDGLEPDNLLAFLALLGLLRALDAARPDWRARAYWQDEPRPLRPVLVLAAPQTREAVVEAAAEGVRMWGAEFDRVGRCAAELMVADIVAEIATIAGRSNWSDKEKRQLEKLRRKKNRLSSHDGHHKLSHIATSDADLKHLLNGAGEVNHGGRFAQIVASMAGETLVTTKGGASEWRSVSTPLKFVSGQMAFFGSLVTLTTAPRADEIERSLFSLWEFKHRGESLRFAPQEARVYALMASDPTKKQKKAHEQNPRRRKRSTSVHEDLSDETTGEGTAPSERGANSLAALGLLSFPCVQTKQAIMTPGYAADGTKEFLSWPLWTSGSSRGWSLAAIEATLDSRLDGRKDMLEFFQRHAIIGVMKSQKFENQDYYNSTGAELISASLVQSDVSRLRKTKSRQV
jgi:hypothetical protein